MREHHTCLLSGQCQQYQEVANSNRKWPYLLCISHSLAPALRSQTQTRPSPPPLTTFQSSACSAVTPSWWPYSEATVAPLRRSNTRTLTPGERGARHELAVHRALGSLFTP